MYLLSNVLTGSEFEQPLSKYGRGFEIFQLVEQIQCSAQSQNLVDWLKVAVGEVGSKLTHTLLLIETLFRQVLAVELHLQTNNVLAAYFDKLLSFCYFLLGLYDQQ